MQSKYLTYKTKVFSGNKMNMPEFKDKVAVAINLKKLQDAERKGLPLLVVNRESKDLKYIKFKNIPTPKTIAEFESKYNLGERYQLYYYIWNPKKQLQLL